MTPRHIQEVNPTPPLLTGAAIMPDRLRMLRKFPMYCSASVMRRVCYTL